MVVILFLDALQQKQIFTSGVDRHGRQVLYKNLAFAIIYPETERMPLSQFLHKAQCALRQLARQHTLHEQALLLCGRQLSETMLGKNRIQRLSEVEFKVFSQWGDDGIIQWLVRNVDFPNTTFIEFGVEDYRESNTRFLMMNNNWSGLVIDGSPKNVNRIRNSEYYWRYDLTAKAAFIDRDNINKLMSDSGIAESLGILHIDLDGNDYWIWKAINCCQPIVVILEYNSVFGNDRAITVPYDKSFARGRAHHSNLFFGASLPALGKLCQEKGYAFIGCNSAGNNAYFIRRNHLNDRVREVSLEAGYVPSRFRESRGKAGNLTLLSGRSRLEAIRGLMVYNVDTNNTEPL